VSEANEPRLRGVRSTVWLGVSLLFRGRYADIVYGFAPTSRYRTLGWNRADVVFCSFCLITVAVALMLAAASALNTALARSGGIDVPSSVAMATPLLDMVQSRCRTCCKLAVANAAARSSAKSAPSGSSIRDTMPKAGTPIVLLKMRLNDYFTPVRLVTGCGRRRLFHFIF